MKYKVVHIVNNEKFISPFINLINENFKDSEHLFLNIGNSDKDKFPLPKLDNVIEFELNLSAPQNLFSLWKQLGPFLKSADKIILHSAFFANFNKYLYFNSSILAKTYWVMWGGDLYQPLISPAKTWKQRIHSFFDNKVKANVAGYITYIPGDYELAKQLYTAKNKYFECIMYPSNIYKELVLPETVKNNKTILLGNSADPTNNHEKLLQKLFELENQNFNIICPLSYGNRIHADKIAKLGHSLFKDRFTALTEFMEFNEYLTVLAKIDIAIFGHERQQAMGNTITLLGLGKKVYMRTNVTQFDFFEKLNIKVFDVDNINLSGIESNVKNENKVIIEKYFSEKNLINQWCRVFK